MTRTAVTILAILFGFGVLAVVQGQVARPQAAKCVGMAIDHTHQGGRLYFRVFDDGTVQQLDSDGQWNVVTASARLMAITGNNAVSGGATAKPLGVQSPTKPRSRR